MKKISMVTCLVAIISTITMGEAFSAQRLLYENFDDKSLSDTPLQAKEGITWRILEPIKDFDWAPGRDGTGYSLYYRQTDSSDSVLMWNNNLPVPWPSDEMYVSFWMRYASFTSQYSHENMKIFHPHWDNVKSLVSYSMATGNKIYYAAYGKGVVLSTSNWIQCDNMADGKWHRYEFYVKFSQGISRFWYDGVLKVNHTYGPGKWTNAMNYIEAPAIDSNETSIFSRQIDDWEVWDGMPPEPRNTTTSQSSAFTAPTNLKVK